MDRFECHIFSGLLSAGAEVGTKELERLIDDLPSTIDAHHHHHGRWKKVLKGILERHGKHGPAKIILIGHSYGALRCQQIAKKLNSEDISVAYVGGIDPTALFSWQPSMKLSKNITLVDEFHATRGFPYSARKNDPSGEGGGKYIIPAELEYIHTVTKVPGSHVKCASASITRQKVLKAIKSLL